MSKTTKQYQYEPLQNFPKPCFQKTLQNYGSMVAMVAFTHDTNNRNPDLVDSSNSVLVQREVENSSSSSSNNYELEGCPTYVMCATDAGKVIVVDLRDNQNAKTVELGNKTIFPAADLYALQVSSDDKFLVCAGNSNSLHKISLHFDDGFKLNVEKSTYQTIDDVISGGDIFGLCFRPFEFLLAQNSDARKYIVAVAGCGKSGDDRKLCLVDIEAEEKVCYINMIPLGKESSVAFDSSRKYSKDIDATYCCWSTSGELLGSCLENGTMIISEVNETPKYKFSSDDSETTATSSSSSAPTFSKYFDIQTHFIDNFKAPSGKVHESPTYSWVCEFCSDTKFVSCAGELVRVYIKNNDFNRSSCTDSETGFDTFFVKSFDIDLSAQGLRGEIQCSSESSASYPQTMYGLSVLNAHTFVTCSESGMLHIVDLSLCEREKHKILQKKQHNEKLTKAEEVLEINRVVAAATDKNAEITGFRSCSSTSLFAVPSFDGELYIFKNFTVSWKWKSVKDVLLVSDRSNTRMKIALEQWKTLRNIVSFLR